MTSTVTISAAGAHASAASTDRIPASKAGVKGYLTPVTLGAFTLGNVATSVLFSSDNSNDIGAAGATRPRNIYAGTSIYTGAGFYFSTTGLNLLSDTTTLTIAQQSSPFAAAYVAVTAGGYLSQPQAAGNTLPGLIDSEVFATTQAVTSLSNSSTGVQNVFASANDVLTLRAATTYFFECVLYINTGNTTHTTAIGFPASSAYTNINYLAELWSTTSGTISTTAPSVLDVAASTATVLNATSAALRTTIRCKGIIRTNLATTVTPQITFSAGPTGTCEVAVNSFFRAWPVGTNTVAAFGDWA